LAMTLSLSSGGCVKKYVEIRVHDGGKVGVGIPTARGPIPVLPPDGVQRSVPVPREGSEAAPLAIRHGRQIAITWSGDPPGLALVDGYGRFPQMPLQQGIEIREGSLWASYNVTPRRILPARDRPSDSIPIVLGTTLDNIAEAREIREPRRWPAYVCLPIGGVFAVLGTALLATGDDVGRVAGTVYLLGAIPLLVYGLVNATASAEAVPLELTSK